MFYVQFCSSFSMIPWFSMRHLASIDCYIKMIINKQTNICSRAFFFPQTLTRFLATFEMTGFAVCQMLKTFNWHRVGIMVETDADIIWLLTKKGLHYSFERWDIAMTLNVWSNWSHFSFLAGCISIDTGNKILHNSCFQMQCYCCHDYNYQQKWQSPGKAWKNCWS